MKFGPIIAAILETFATQLMKASLVFNPQPAPAVPVPVITAVPSKHVLPIEAPPDLHVGPWPKEPQVITVHTTVPMPTPDPSRVTPGPKEAMLTQAIYAQNRGLAFFNGISEIFNANTGSKLHPIDMTTAHMIALVVMHTCIEEPLDLAYALAQIAKESAFDPKAENGNYGPGESNPSKAPEGFDIGLCQLKIEYLLNQVDYTGAKIETVEEAYTMALDVNRAVPFFAKKSLGLVAWAKKNVSSLPKQANAKFQNPYYLAAGAYNFGTDPERGVFSKIAEGQDLKHCVDVAAMTAHFATILGTPNVFAPPTVSA